MSAFGEIPPMLRETEIDFRAFYYEHDERLFVVGGKEISVGDERLQHELRFPDGEPVPKEQINSHPVLLGLWAEPLATPKFYTWLDSQSDDSSFVETTHIMKEVFEEVSGEPLQGRHHNKMHPFGFSAGLLRKGHLNLSVIGNCACLGSNPDGHTVDWEDWDSGFVEMTLHNIDTRPQHVSIMAGLGHLALRCSDDTF